MLQTHVREASSEALYLPSLLNLVLSLNNFSKHYYSRVLHSQDIAVFVLDQLLYNCYNSVLDRKLNHCYGSALDQNLSLIHI